VIVRGLGSTLVQPGTVRPLAGIRLKPLSRASLRALVPAVQTRGRHALKEQGVVKHGHRSQAAQSPVPVVGIRPPDPPAPSVIQQVERVVPAGVWIALAAALALAAVGGVATAVAGRRSRRQTARLAAVSAQALTDPLTGVLNRRGFLDALERELARARRYDRPVALAYVDVRGLKAVNDSEGHLAGDELLREAAGMLEDSARADDVVGRIGGDELALLLGEQSIDGATVVANRIKAQVPARRAMLRLREPWDLTIGTASYPADGATVDELLAAADRRLYEQRGIDIR
jgi:diguanylate cyclase (GGDEF)-like protein